MPPKKGGPEGPRRAEKLPTVEVLLRNMQETWDISWGVLAEHRVSVEREARSALESGNTREMDRVAKSRRALDEVEDRAREVREVIRELETIKDSENNNKEGMIRGAMKSYQVLQEALRNAENLLGPLTNL